MENKETASKKESSLKKFLQNQKNAFLDKRAEKKEQKEMEQLIESEFKKTEGVHFLTIHLKAGFINSATHLFKSKIIPCLVDEKSMIIKTIHKIDVNSIEFLSDKNDNKYYITKALINLEKFKLKTCDLDIELHCYMFDDGLSENQTNINIVNNNIDNSKHINKGVFGNGNVVENKYGINAKVNVGKTLNDNKK